MFILAGIIMALRFSNEAVLSDFPYLVA